MSKQYQAYYSMEIKTVCNPLLAIPSPIHTSTIIPQHQQQFITKKLPLAQKRTLEQYRQRTALYHPNLPTIILDLSSPFYFTLHIETIKPINIQDLKTLPTIPRIKALIDILKTVIFLASHFGYFYLLEGMVGHRPRREKEQFGIITVWINSDVLLNYRKSPIDHSSLSEEIFVQDFKETYISQLTNQRDFHSAKTIESLLRALQQKQYIHQSLFVGLTPKAPIGLRASLIAFGRQNIDISVAEWRQKTSVNVKKNLCFTKSLIKRPLLLKSARRRLQRKQTAASIYIDKYSGYDVLFKDEESRRASIYYFDEEEKNGGRKLGLSTSCSHFTNRPQSPKLLISECGQQFFNEQSLTKAAIPPNRPGSCLQQIEERLKFSFPHTTTHTFLPYSSNGNLTIACNESMSLEKKGIKPLKQESPPNNQRITEEQIDVQMELDCLFSRSSSDAEGTLNLQTLVQEFQQMLSA